MEETVLRSIQVIKQFSKQKEVGSLWLAMVPVLAKNQKCL